jgi:hypothetical protein
MEGSIMADLRASGLGGIPKGETADRPSSPSIGDVFYNGTLGCLEIYTSQGWVANSAPPGIPVIGTSTNVGTSRAYNNGAASVVFTPGEGGGLPNSYRATSVPSGFTGTASTSPITVSGLQSGTSYTFSVTGTNNFGTSASSSNSNSITATTLADAPVIGTLSYVSTTSLSLVFTAPATGGSSITNYKYSTDGVTYTAFSPAQTSSPLTFSGLTPSTNYSFYIKAVNSNGDSVASSASNTIFTGATVSGGTLTSDATYYYRTFTSTGQLAITGPSISTNYLSVAGGGGGGGYGGGGGAGGYLASTLTIPANTYTVTIGAGGAGGNDTYTVGSNGIDTSFYNVLSYGGGGGGKYESVNGSNGGSGGGGGISETSGSNGGAGGAGVSGQGNNGGACLGLRTGGIYRGGGGGGGAGAAGSSNGGGTIGGAGGAGLQWLDNNFYAGGGGGKSQGSQAGGAGGSGIGGNGGNDSASATAASVNRGSGGGSGPGNNANNQNISTPGSSGVVIIRYLRSAVGG